MVGRFWFCMLLVAAVGICGCEAENKAANMGMTATKAGRKMVKPDSNIVKLETSKGDIVIELDGKAAPVTVKNFLRYVNEGFYDGLIFHRVIPGFMIQGGGMTLDLAEKKTYAPIANEANNGLKNERGTIAMARTPDGPHTATCQFYINHVDNMPLNYMSDAQPGYAVFGKVIKGMDVVDTIASVKTTRRRDQKGRLNTNIPVEPVIIRSATVVSQ